MRRFQEPASEPPPASAVLPIRVYYEDTDAAGVVYYANYLRFCERARTEWLRALGFEQSRMLAERAIAFVVKRVEADYRLPARLDDELAVHTRVAELGRASLTFVQEVRRREELLFNARVLIACIDTGRGKPCAIPADLRNTFDQPVHP